MIFSPLLTQLIESLRTLPGVGHKTAQRMAFNILERNKEGGLFLAKSLTSAINNIGNCQQCRILSELSICNICSSKSRDPALLCVVESPANVALVEQTGSYNGFYFVLTGHLSPIDGIGPEDVGIDYLVKRFKDGLVKEVILATSATVEGETTAYYIADLAKAQNISVTQIAHGVPLGGELDYVDASTIAKALAQRRDLLVENS